MRSPQQGTASVRWRCTSRASAIRAGPCVQHAYGNERPPNPFLMLQGLGWSSQELRTWMRQKHPLKASPLSLRDA